MKRLSSKEPVPTIKRVKGQAVKNEPFDIPETDEFQPVNKTRKVQYPMVLKRYNVEKRIKEWDMDDFRKAMDYIVFNKNNDELFDKNLSNNNQSGRTS